MSKVTYEKRGEIAYITLNRPEKRNAIDAETDDLNTCGVGIAMELELMSEPISAERAKEVHLVNRVVPREQLMSTMHDIAAKILRHPRVAVESAKETILEVVGRPIDDQLGLECLYSYSTIGNPEIGERKDEFLAHGDAGRSDGRR